jgi:hypothetical protein
VYEEAYRERVRSRAADVRDCVILGHRLEVYFRDEDLWHVVVDGEESLARFANAFAAWAAGAAESYRQGRTPGSPPLHD